MWCEVLLFFFSNTPAPAEISTLSLHDALPISYFANARGHSARVLDLIRHTHDFRTTETGSKSCVCKSRSEEHTSELQSHHDLVCRLLLEKKKKTSSIIPAP